MTTSYRVDTERIATASSDIHRIAGSIDSEVRAMMARLTELQGVWQGSAATGFTAVTEDWRRTTDQVRQALESISRALATAGQQYANAEQSNAAMFRL